MNPLVIMGFQEHETADIKADPWDLVYQFIQAGVNMTADDVEECVQNNDGDCLKATDLVGREVVYCYSWGLESLRKVTNDFADLKCKLLVIVLGVEDPTGVTKWGVDLSKFAGRAVCFYLGPNLAFPVDQTIKGAPYCKFYEYPGPGKFPDKSFNVSLESLAKSVPWYLGWLMGGTKIWNHTHVMNDPKLLAALIGLYAV